jgi:hypothetical protein
VSELHNVDETDISLSAPRRPHSCNADRPVLLASPATVDGVALRGLSGAIEFLGIVFAIAGVARAEQYRI